METVERAEPPLPIQHLLDADTGGGVVEHERRSDTGGRGYLHGREHGRLVHPEEGRRPEAACDKSRAAGRGGGKEDTVPADP